MDQTIHLIKYNPDITFLIHYKALIKMCNVPISNIILELNPHLEYLNHIIIQILDVKVRVIVFGPIRELIGVEETTLDILEGSSVLKLLSLLTQIYGDKFQKIVGDYRQEHDTKHLFISVNDTLLDNLEDGSDHVLRNMDAVKLVPISTGG